METKDTKDYAEILHMGGYLSTVDDFPLMHHQFIRAIEEANMINLWVGDKVNGVWVEVDKTTAKEVKLFFFANEVRDLELHIVPTKEKDRCSRIWLTPR